MQSAQNLHHISIIYAGAVMELATGKEQGLIASDAPGVKKVRDLVDIVLLTRAENNALVSMLVKKGVFTSREFTDEVGEQYKWFTDVKAKQFNVQVRDYGLVFGRQVASGLEGYTPPPQ